MWLVSIQGQSYVRASQLAVYPLTHNMCSSLLAIVQSGEAGYDQQSSNGYSKNNQVNLQVTGPISGGVMLGVV